MQFLTGVVWSLFLVLVVVVFSLQFFNAPRFDLPKDSPNYLVQKISTTPTPNPDAATPNVTGPESDGPAPKAETTAQAPDVTSDSGLIAQLTNQSIPNVVANARAEAVPKKKRLASGHRRDHERGNNIWWLWGF